MSEKTARVGCLAIAGLLLAVFVLGVGGRLAMLFWPASTTPSQKNKNEPPAAVAAQITRPKNVSQAGYLGTASCQTCHAEICESYSQHPMARSAALIPIPDNFVSDSAPNSEFAAKRNLHYRVEKSESRIVHHEIALGDDGQVRYDQAVPISLVIGAGKRAYSYAANYDGILYESPISWYSADGGYFQLSPGYDENNIHFNRRWFQECVICHLGRTESDEKGKFHFTELTLGCERCHGPGENHVKLQSAKSTPAPDLSIVNPARLPYRERESVCNDCHLTGEFRTTRYGRRASDFRPGMALEEVSCVLIRPMSQSGAAEIVSQVEQMRSSKCFLESQGSMGCITCHDPHREPAADAKPAHYRSRCLKCHESAGCSLPAAERAVEQDSCISCHMPRDKSITVIHISQTDHRIPRDKESPLLAESVPSGNQDLEFFDRAFDRIPQWEVERVMALRVVKNPAATVEDAEAALETLMSIAERVPDDVEVLQGIGIVAVRLRRSQVARIWLEKALREEPSNEYIISNLAATCLQLGDFQAALKHSNQCLDLNPYCANHFMLQAQSLAALGKREGAATAAKQALELDRSLSGTLKINRLMQPAPKE